MEKPGRPKYFSQRMIKQDVRLPVGMMDTLKTKAGQLSQQAGRRITASDLIRTAIERLLKGI